MSDEMAGTTSEPAKLPWERRSEMDVEKAFALTILAFLRPKRAWERTPESGGYPGPLLFAALSAFLGTLFAATWNLLMFRWYLHRHPGFRPRTMPAFLGNWVVHLSNLNIILSPIFNTAFAVLFVFVAAAIIHVGVFLVGGRKRSTSGFEGSFRVAAYGAAGLIGDAVPLLGALLAFVWCAVLAVTGVARMHRMSIARAIAAVVVPFAVIFGVMFAFGSK
ncbi:MAG TPA: YIP1 family protein [Thermoanaerobaculia bacterium]|nr:YIP1 family protein [Thermoanaerobaculia bacterium]